MSQCPSPAAAQASAPLQFHRPLAAIDSSAAEQLFELPFLDLLYRAQTVHRQHHRANEVQLSSLLSIKTGGCAEDCGYCSQSAHHKEAGVPAGKLMGVDEVVQAAQAARDQGATRFCMGAAWRNPKQRDMAALTEMVSQVRALGLETCMTLGMLEQAQAEALKQAGLDYYNHNLDTAPDFYGQVISTRSYQDRLDTLQRVQKAGLNVCCGGIIGMGETRAQRAGLIAQLASLPVPPQSVPINHLVPIAGTPLQDVAPLDEFEFVRTVAVARIALPHAVIRLSAGRESMSEATQALCFAAGANSIFLGAKLLTTANAPVSADLDLLQRLGLQAAAAAA
ncbi:biotin synthase BioB [Herbaspirillum huttiense]|uniref:biotin synthase BioB n=1 Tax=Herbaspirillum huttiense TaxID=863372 RepID=UPI0031DE60EB